MVNGKKLSVKKIKIIFLKCKTVNAFLLWNENLNGTENDD